MIRSSSILVLACSLLACSSRSVGGADEATSSSEAEADDGGSSVTSESTTSTPPNPATSDPSAGEESGTVTTDDGDSFTSESGNADPCDSPCDPDTLQGCVDGQKCVPMNCYMSSVWDTYGCIDIMGADQLGEDCEIYGEAFEGADSCAEGMICLGNGEQGSCHALCLGEVNDLESLECPEGSECVITSNGAQRLCIPYCNPLLDDCSQNHICVPNGTGDGFVCALDASGDMAPYGTPCNYVNVCNPGLVCVDASLVPEASCAGQSGCCTPFCDLDEATPCPGQGQTCQPWFEEPIAGLENVGACVL